MKGYVNHLVVNKTKSLIETSIFEEYNRGYSDGFQDGYNEAQGIDTQSQRINSVPVYIPIEKLNLSIRSYNCIKRAGIDTVKDLIDRSEEDMMKVRNLGSKSFEEIKEKLKDMGLSFRKFDDECVAPELHTRFFKQVVFSKIDEAFYRNEETLVSVNTDGEIFAKNSIYDCLEKKCCEYKISVNDWENFASESLIILDAIKWNQTNFESFDLENYIHNDVSYSIEFVLSDGEALKFCGVESSKGVLLFTTVLNKYLAPPKDIQFTTVQTTDRDLF